MGGNRRALTTYLRERRLQVERDAPLGPRTTFRIGGPARILALPDSVEELKGLWDACRDLEVPVRVLGSGANLLVGDNGFDGVVIQLGRMKDVSVFDTKIRAEAGASFPKLVIRTVRAGLRGFEGLGGIPANVGGAVFMNAGGRYGEIFDVIESVETLDPEGRVRILPRSEIPFTYRRSGLEGHVILAATFRLEADAPEVLTQEFTGIVRAKRSTQPMRQHCAGCIFKNPPGMSAGRAIERSGMKGRREGSAIVSAKHANFIVNTGKATASEVLKLIDTVRDAVRARMGVELKQEVLVW